MSKKQVTIAFQTDKPITAYGPLAAAVEGYGFDGVTVYNDLLYQPAWLPLMEMARQTKRLRLGPAAVNPFTSHPINIAGNIALLDELSQGRAYLGLARGSWHDLIGVKPERPLTALHEAFLCIRHLLTRSIEPFSGEIFPVAAGAALRWQGGRADIPFLLGSWGPKAMQRCLPHITEIKLGGTSNPDVIPQVQAYLSDSEDQQSDVGIVVGAVTVVDEDGEAAKALARREAALYLPIIASLDHTLKIEPDRLDKINQAAVAYDFEQAGRYISDDLLKRVAFAGTPDEVAEQALALFEAGVARVEFGTPHGLSPENGVRLLGEQVLPSLQKRIG